jgi:putative Mg2+ transporter-C (MgtC) family protein
MIETTYLGTSDFILRMGTALLLGGAIGFERQWRQKSAGLRTNTLVSLGAAAYILLSVYINGADGGDAGRIAAQIVTGIGFLGAGVIMKDGLTIQGLNTAATIWCSAAVGSLAGIGMFPQALIVTIAIISTHLIMRPISDKLSKINSYKKGKREESFYLLTILCKEPIESQVRSFLVQYLDSSDKYLLRSISRKRAENAGNIIVEIKFSTVGRQENMLESLIQKLTVEMGVEQATWAYAREDHPY